MEMHGQVEEPGQKQQLMFQVTCQVCVWVLCTMLVCAQGRWRWELLNMSFTLCSQFYQIYRTVFIYPYSQ